MNVKELPLAPQWVVRCLRKRPLNETLGKVLFQRRKPPSGVSFSHLNKHRLINSLEEYIDETGLCRENTQTSLPLEISPKVPESEVGRDCQGCHVAARTLRRAHLLTPVNTCGHLLPGASCEEPLAKRVAGRAGRAAAHHGCRAAGWTQAWHRTC